ncbi:hypothetical protein ACIA8K_39430 [Catenuloplanes sp. NPDC051500]|uniref:hypothetical protein n=1 Tax=Catenuloplanes sp. NPDC051500 TaxID=3363959 RepID=UPI0037AEE3EB
MRSPAVNTDSRLHLWRHIRAYAVPPTMITSAAARRRAGDWAGACAASRVDVDLNLRDIARAHGTALAAELRSDLRHLAPDLLRWHLPRVAPDGLLRPALTVGLARYGPALWLVARTAPAWADAGQRISLALWPGDRAGRHPHPRPDPRFRLDLHRHLWDARHAPELRERAGVPTTASDRAGVPTTAGDRAGVPTTASDRAGVPTAAGDRAGSAAGSASAVPDLLRARGCAVDLWAAEAARLLRCSGRTTGSVSLRLGTRESLVLRLAGDGPPRLDPGAGRGLPALPDAAVWEPPDLALLRAGLIAPDDLHPLVAAALVPGFSTPDPAVRSHPEEPPGVRIVRCRGADHRIATVDGVLRPLDHAPDEIRREELLAALTGTPLPCLQTIDDLHRRPADLDDVRARLDHGDIEGALHGVEAVLGAAAVLRDGPLRDELEAAAQQRVLYGMYRAGIGPMAGVSDPDRLKAPRHDPFAPGDREPWRELGRDRRWSRYRRH